MGEGTDENCTGSGSVAGVFMRRQQTHRARVYACFRVTLCTSKCNVEIEIWTAAGEIFCKATLVPELTSKAALFKLTRPHKSHCKMSALLP